MQAVAPADVIDAPAAPPDLAAIDSALEQKAKDNNA
jgi:hypothetical protein